VIGAPHQRQKWRFGKIVHKASSSAHQEQALDCGGRRLEQDGAHPLTHRLGAGEPFERRVFLVGDLGADAFRAENGHANCLLFVRGNQ
jgi:hypothetical protein